MDRNIDAQGCCDNCVAEVVDETQSGYKFLLWVSRVRRGTGPACSLLSQSSHLSWPKPMGKINSGSSKGLPHFSSKKTEKERPAHWFGKQLPPTLLLSLSPSLSLFSEINSELAQSPTYHISPVQYFFSLYPPSQGQPAFHTDQGEPQSLVGPSTRLLAATREAVEIWLSTHCVLTQYPWSSKRGQWPSTSSSAKDAHRGVGSQDGSS